MLLSAGYITQQQMCIELIGYKVKADLLGGVEEGE